MIETHKINRITTQRKTIFEELSKYKSHPTADELYEIVRKRLPKISLGTVYRNLDVLAKSGKIRKLDLGAGQFRFDADLSRHYHIRCVECYKIEDVFDLPDFNWENIIDQKSEFEVLGYELEFRGLCPSCKAK
jgi:Fur family ferric uptake transcriptional regulator